MTVKYRKKSVRSIVRHRLCSEAEILAYSPGRYIGWALVARPALKSFGHELLFSIIRLSEQTF